MEQNKIVITAENSAEWLASCGYLFPSTEAELFRFNKLFGETDASITGREIDPFKIIRKSTTIVRYGNFSKLHTKKMDQHKLVARNLNSLPQHIIRLVKKDENSGNE